MRAEFEKGLSRPGAPLIYRGWELDLPSGQRRYSNTDVPWPTGNYAPKIVAGGFGTIGVGIDLRSNTLASVETTVEIADTDRDFATEQQRYRKSIRGSAARCRLLSPNLSDADAHTAFAGILRGFDQVAPFRWRLRFGPPDDALQNGYVPDVAVSKSNFANAHRDALGQYIPAIYGAHSSQGTTAQGFVRLLCVDTSTFVYLVARGRVTVSSVFKDGAQVAAANYSIVYHIYGGRLYTAVKFTATQADSAITADVQGLTDREDGAGTLITNPADQLKHFLANFVFGQWDGRSAYLAPGAAAIDLASFEIARAFFADHEGYEKSRWIGGGEQQRAIDLVNDWATSVECKLYWTELGKLAIRPLDYRPLLDPYAEDQWIHLTEDDVGEFTQAFAADQIVSKVSLQYLYGEAAGKFFNEILVSDLGAGVDVTESRQDRWSKAGV